VTGGAGARPLLAAVGVEGRVAGAKRLRRVVNREFEQRHELGPVVTSLAGKGAEHVSNCAVNVSNHAITLDLARGVVVVRGPEDQRGAACTGRSVQKALVNHVLRSDTSTSRTSRAVHDALLTSSACRATKSIQGMQREW
jgi:hypothetical protein